MHESEVMAHERVTRPGKGEWTRVEGRLGVRGEGTLHVCTCEGDEERRGYARARAVRRTKEESRDSRHGHTATPIASLA